MSAKDTKKPQGEVPTTGHQWDGIEEFDNPMPRWWVWVFLITIVWGIGYTIAYPSWPMITQATRGWIGNDERVNVAAEISGWDARNAEVKAKLVATEMDQIQSDPQLTAYANNAGAAVFRTYCAQCHGAGAAGVQSLGYPNLLDDDWLWGGDFDAIRYTIAHGIRNTTDPEARYSEMPKFGADQLLEKPQIAEVVEHVLALSGQEHDARLASAGAQVYADNCSSCHGESGKGDREQGAPDLTDAVWLYGGTREAITHSVNFARFGVMPNWSNRLSEDEIRAVTFYVHGLGGGE